MDAFTYEQQKLQSVLSELEVLKERLQQIPRYYGKDIVEQALDDQRQQQLKNLRISQAEPYFGRLDFQEAGSDAIVPLYIGKAGVQDERTNELLVIDWRAPVSSMFYSFTGQDAPASYDSPEGKVTGDIFLKRNIAIRERVLHRVVDSYVQGAENAGVADEFLLYRLGENKDSRLQDIVSTIQHEQDQIIRADYNKSLIIQGVPGSGKTTVALHRLAFLLYQYQQKIKAEKVIVFAPNKMFMDYISEVLPELGVGDIRQTTFVEWALDILGEALTVSDRHLQLANSEKRTKQGSDVHKGSEQFLHTVPRELDVYEAQFVPDNPFIAWDQHGISAETVRQWFDNEYRYEPLMKRKERVLARIKRWIEMEYKEIQSADRSGALKKQANKRFAAYKRMWPKQSALQWYHARFGEKSTRQKEIAYEALAPLVYIQGRFYGIDRKYHHIVIDEAQDFSPFQVALLKEYCPSQSFTILGDILQNIYAEQGISQWKQFSDLFATNRTQFYQLDRSYRSTMEIIQFANELIDAYRGDMRPATPVFRSGEPVKVVQKANADKMNWLVAMIAELQQKQTHTIAIIARNDRDCENIHASLLEQGISANLISLDQQSYYGGISVVPVYLTKGMEFDAVVLVDVTAENYPDDDLHAKLLYVGCTRALHKLYLVYDGEVSPLVEDNE